MPGDLPQHPVLVFCHALFARWLALMSSAVFTFIAIYAAATTRSNLWIVWTSGSAAFLLFFAAAYRAWRDEHGARLAAEAQLVSERPAFEMAIKQSIPWYNQAKDLTYVMLLVELINRGATSPAINWRARLNSPWGADLQLYRLLDPELHIKVREGRTLVLTQSDLIQSKVLPTVLRNHVVAGRALLTLPGNQKGKDIDLTVMFDDQFGRTCSALYRTGPLEPGKYPMSERFLPPPAGH